MPDNYLRAADVLTEMTGSPEAAREFADVHGRDAEPSALPDLGLSDCGPAGVEFAGKGHDFVLAGWLRRQADREAGG